MNNFLMLLHNLLVVLKSGQLPQVGYGTYFLLAGLVAVEGPVATLLGAIAASAGLMRPALVFLAAATGNLTADILWYSLGYLGKTEWLFRLGHRLGVRRHLIEFLKQNMILHAAKVLFLAKVTLSLVIPTLIAAGLVRAPWRRWLPALVGAEMLWTGSLVLIGYYATEAIKRVERGIEYAALTTSVLLLVILMLAGHRLIKEWERDAPDPVSDVGR